MTRTRKNEGEPVAGTVSRLPVGLRWWQHALVFALACVVLVARRPDAVFHAQFYAEDGHVWMADAYNLGWWPALFRTWTGYFLTLPRLGAAVAMLAPLHTAPLILNLIAIAVAALPATLLLMTRSRRWGPLGYRACLAGMYLALPNCCEMGAGITESQWLLALSAFLLVVAEPPNNRFERCCDLSLLALCGLTGPFCIFLMPVAIYMAIHRQGRWPLIVTAWLGIFCLVQAAGMLLVKPFADPLNHRASGLLGLHLSGADLALLVRMIAGEDFAGTLLGGNGLTLQPGHWAFAGLSAVATGGVTLMTLAWLRAEREMKLLIVFSTMLLGAALLSPTVTSPTKLSVWMSLAQTPETRYWFFPTLAFAWTLLWAVQQRKVALRWISAALLCVMCFGVVRDWQRPPFGETAFEQSARSFEEAAPGTIVTIPLNPKGWSMQLEKHPMRGE
jgi:hypothetical protein